MALNPQNQQAVIPDKEKQPSKQGTGFVNLQKYLGANQNNQLGGAVSGNIQGANQQAQQNLKQQQGQFGTNVAQSRAGIAQGQQNVSGAFQKLDAPQFGGIGDQDVSQFKALREQGYTGPIGLQNAQQLQQQAANAASLGKLAGSREGRQELLRETIHAPQYTGAQQRLDELFMSLGGGAQNVRQAGQAVKKTPEQINRGIQAAQSEGLGTQKSYQGLQQNAAQGLQSRNAAMDQALNQQYAQAQSGEQQRQANLAAYKQAIASGNAGAAPGGLFDAQTAADIQALGGAGGQFANLVASHINPGSVDLSSRGQSASEMQRQQANALAQLAGNKGEFEGFTAAKNKAAGLDKLGPDTRNALEQSLYGKYGFDQNKLNSLNPQVESALNTDRQQYASWIQNLVNGAQSRGTNNTGTLDQQFSHFNPVLEGKQSAFDAANDILSGKIGGGNPFGTQESMTRQRFMDQLNQYKDLQSQQSAQQQAREKALNEFSNLSPIAGRYS